MITSTRWPDETENKPIPDPWEVRHVTKDWAVICPVGYVTRICELSSKDKDALSPRDLANADLIAAAPDLLLALQRVSAYLSIHVTDYWEGNADADRIRAAIAAATGEPA